MNSSKITICRIQRTIGNEDLFSSGVTESMEQVVKGLKVYFNKALGNILLFRFERLQYVDLTKNHKDKTMGEIYGVMHLLRLFGLQILIVVQLPSLIAHTNMDADAICILRDHLVTFLKSVLFHVDIWRKIRKLCLLMNMKTQLLII
jgi:hypothetical protein